MKGERTKLVKNRRSRMNLNPASLIERIKSQLGKLKDLLNLAVDLEADQVIELGTHSRPDREGTRPGQGRGDLGLPRLTFVRLPFNTLPIHLLSARHPTSRPCRQWCPHSILKLFHHIWTQIHSSLVLIQDCEILETIRFSSGRAIRITALTIIICQCHNTSGQISPPLHHLLALSNVVYV